jgi:diaminohydroxyphosphoribosylaminopyrimidine deaminase / 5-amino-6-(5-phosphoribosylamino)uracil reductase
MRDDAHWMRRCLFLASQAEGLTTPNPLVGAVVLNKDGELVSEGFHRAPGEFHAERDALMKVQGPVKGGTVYVNLEPCCAWGRTPPCTDILIEKGIQHVVVGMMDPDPRMKGKGILDLREKGITVSMGICEDECRRLNEAYLRSRLSSRPMVTLKVAATLDGRIVDYNGHSQWITGEAARLQGQHLRKINDAIMVGVGTILSDNPSLNVRLDGGKAIQPVVIDTKLRSPQSAKIHTAGLQPWFYCSDGHNKNLDYNSRTVPLSRNGVDLRTVLSDLHGRDIYSVLVEGGAKLASSLIEENLVDRIELFMAPIILGGGKSWVDALNIPLKDAPRFEIWDTQKTGADVWIRLRKRELDV